MTRNNSPEVLFETLSQRLPKEADIAIIGGGLTGLCAALFLARQQPLWTILLLESADASNHSVTSSTEPGFHHRHIALAESSRRLFEKMGLWPEIVGQCAAITDIQVSDRGHPGYSQLTASEQNLDAYGYVIDASKLMALVSKAVTSEVNIQRVTYPTQLSAEPLPEITLKPTAQGMIIQLGDVSVFAQLAVLANGEQPEQARELGVQFSRKEYDRVALTAELTLGDAHRGIAYERFTRDGPIALLPLPDENNSSRASLVWTLEPAQAQQLLSTEVGDFIDRLRVCFSERAGVIKSVAYRRLMPLSLTLASEQVRSHLVLMGSAAHSLHPVAGQGFNLTLRDIAGLCETLKNTCDNGKSLGDLATLQLYEHKRTGDQQQVVAFSDALPALFSSTNPPLSVARNMGLLGLGLAPGLRELIVQLGAGLLPREAQING